MNSLFELWRSALDLFGNLEPYQKFMAAALALYLPIRSYFWPSWRLLRLSLYWRYPQASMRALLELLYCLFYVRKTHSLFQAARLRIEVELLIPRPRPAFPGAVPITQRLKMRGAHLCALWAWRGALARSLTRIAGEVRSGDPDILVKTCFDVYNALDEVNHYFQALARCAPSDIEDTDRFLVLVKIEQGFIAPQHLLTGMLTHFDKGWVQVIGEYGHAITRRGDVLGVAGLRRLQTFLFDCWLMWGPSIPLCTCDMWNGSYAMQYGYGDENNSMPLCGEDLGKKTEPLYKEFARRPFPPVAIQVSVAGRLRCGCLMAESNLCSAQQNLCAEDAGPLLELVSIEPIGGKPEDGSRIYYSAYVWIMFVLCDTAGAPLFPQEPWRALLPFYEHCNIADGRTYDFLKRQLARKALAALARLVADHADLRAVYACAVDDSACDADLHPMLRFAPSGPLLRELLTGGLSEHPILTRDPQPHLVLAPPAAWQGAYSSCHLPEIVKAYYAYVETIGK